MKHLTVVIGAVLFSGLASANPAHERLMKMSSSERNGFLSGYVERSGESCGRVIRNFFQGGNDQYVFWNVACSNGKSYAIQVNNDSGGSSRIMGCAMLKAVNAGECFKRF
jgi:hypothetical protein